MQEKMMNRTLLLVVFVLLPLVVYSQKTDFDATYSEVKTLIADEKFSEAYPAVCHFQKICSDLYGDKSPFCSLALTYKAMAESQLCMPDSAYIHIVQAEQFLKNNKKVPTDILQLVRTLKASFALVYNVETTSSIDYSLQNVKSFDEVPAVLYSALFLKSKGKFHDALILLENILNFYNQNLESVQGKAYIGTAASTISILVSEGKYKRAEFLLNKAFSVAQQKKMNAVKLRSLYLQRGALYLSLKNYDLSLLDLQEAKRAYEQINDNTLQYSSCLSALSTLYLEQQEYALSRIYADESLYVALLNSTQDKPAGQVLVSMSNVAFLYQNLGMYKKSNDLFHQIMDQSTKYGLNDSYVSAANNIAIMETWKGNCEDALSLLKSALKKAPMQYKYTIYQNILLCLYVTSNPEYVSYIEEFMDTMDNIVLNVLATYSESERDEYWQDISQVLTSYINLGLEKFGNNPAMRDAAYLLSLKEKNLLLVIDKIANSVTHGNFPVESKKYASSIMAIRGKISDYRTPKGEIPSLRTQLSYLERQLLLTLPNLNLFLGNEQLDVNHIQSKLHKNEVAVEFIKLPTLRGWNMPDYKYGALVLKEGNESPVFVKLGDILSVDSIMHGQENQEIKSMYSLSDDRLYRLLWEKICSLVPSGSRIYYSKIGDLNQINMDIISDGKQRMNEKYDMFLLSSTMQIGRVTEFSKIKNAVIYGGVNYYSSTEDMIARAKVSDNYRGELNRDSWDMLPGSFEEVIEIDSIFKKHKLSSVLLTGNDATESSIKSMDGSSPSILHLSTHGFYVPLPYLDKHKFIRQLSCNIQRKDAMIHSGLLFAGANNAWNGESVPEGIDDGILTADEISRLDLDRTKLVVLSACDTALGSISAEGVYGIQRALKQAGVGEILMSLWKVDDEATKILMTKFYQLLLDGYSSREALRGAQQFLVSNGGEFSSPIYWGAFEIMD